MAHTIDEIRKLRNGRGTSAASSSDSTKTRSTGHSVEEIRRLGGRNVYEDSEGYKPTYRADLNVSAPSKPTSNAYRYGTPSGNATLDQLNTMMNNFNKIQAVLSTPKNMPDFKSDAELKDYYESIPDYNVFERIGDSEKTEKYNQKQALSSKYNEIKKANDLATLNAYGITEDELKKAQTYLQGANGGIFNKKYMNERTSKEEMQKIYDKFDRVKEETGINPYELQFDYQTEIDEELANEHPVLSTIDTYVANPVESTLNTGKKVINYATGKPIENDYSYTNNIRNTITNNIDTEAGRFAYGTVNSIADMAVAAGLSHLTGSRMLGPELQGFEKADAVMNESVNRGLNPTQVMMEGIASGITTAATESIPMGKWEEIAEKKLVGLGKEAIKKNIVKKLLAGMASEGLQEMSEDVADLLVDRLIAGDKSEIDTNIRTLMESNPGMTKEEAEAQAWKDWCVQVVLDGVGGAISGGVMSGLSIGVGLANPYATGYINREALSEQIKSMSPESEVYKTYQDLAQKRGETLASASDDEVSDLFQKAYAEASKADRTAYEKVISDKLKEAGYTDEQVKATLEALTAKNLTKRQKFLIDNELVRDAVNEADNTEGLKMVQQVAERIEAIDSTIKSSQEIKEEKRIAEAESKINTDTESSVRGDKVEIYGMDIKGGVYVVNTSKGSFPVEDVKIASDIQDAVTHSVNISDDNLKEAFVKNYHGQDISAYEAYAYRAFTAGKSFNQNLIDENTIDFLGSEAVHDFLDAGRLSVRKQTKESEERAIQAASEAKGKFKQGTFTNNVDYSKLDSTRKKIFNFLKGMSNIGGLHINVINDINDQNGMFQYDPNGGTITVNLAAGATDANGNNTQLASYIIPTLSHEMTHYLEANAPSAYNALEKAVLKALRAEGFDIDAEVSKKIDAYKKATNGKVVLSESEALDEIIAQSCEGMMSNEETMEKTLSFMNMKEVKTFKKALEKFFNTIKSFIKSLVGSDAQMNRYALAINKNIDDIQDAWAKALALALERQQILNGELDKDVGIQIDENTNTVAHSIRTTLLESYQDLKYKSYDEAVTETAKSIANQLKESDEQYEELYNKALEWVKSEESIAAFIAKDDNKDFLDYIPDERYQAIKQNSDYAQGTFDLSNLCRKRELFTLIFDNLQMSNPDILFTAEDIALIRDVMVNAKEEVACALCYVEDRRQLMGEIAETFINMYKDALNSKDKAIIKINNEGKKKNLKVTKEQSEKYGYEQGSFYKATDNYIPTQADLITYKGFKNLTKEHPTIAHAFENYNNSRGMQAGRLVEGHAEYKREVLNYTKSQVESKNNKGGLRIFSFSDLEGIHVIDLMQLLIDCASKGVYAQAYTKVPAFARIVKDTGVKLNRSLIPANKDSKNAYAFIDGKWTKVVGKIKENGIATVNGKEYLAVDTVEGIDVTSKDFINDPSNPNIGNIIIGISDKQIKLALDDPNVDYVIPFHTGQSEKILHIKGIDVWDNYKDIQEDKGDGEKINIYTDVIDKYNVTNKKEFVDSFLEECAKRGLTPRFDKFKGEDGYYKLLLDYKLFDENGNILPQGKITPAFDTETLEYIKSFLLADKERSKNLKLSDETMNKIYEEFDKMGKHLNPVGEETRQRYSIREDSEGNKLTEDQAKFFKDSKVVDENGNLKVMYHGTYNGGFTVFDPLKSDDDISLFFSDNETVSKSYADTFARRFNVYEEKPEKITNAKDAKEYLETKGFANIDSYTDKAYGKTNTYWSITTPEGRRLYGLTNSDFIKYAEEIRNTKKGVYAVYLNVTNPLTIDAEGRRWNNLTGYGNISRYPAWYIGSLTVFCHDDGVYQLRPKNLSISKGDYSIADIEEKFGDEFADIIYKIPIGEDAIFENLAVNYDVKKVKPNGTRTAAIMAKLSGKDGVIFNNLIDNGGGWGVIKEAAVPSTIAIAFDPNQIKSIDNEHPTQDPDIRYSVREDSDGNKLTKEQAEFFKDSKIVDKNGNLKVEYHGTNSDFFVFDTNNFGGVNGKAEGYGIYFTDDQEITSVYGGRQLKGYVNITKPAYSTKKTIKSTDLVKLIKTLCENEAKQFVESGDYDSVADAIKDTWVSNYEYTYDKSMNEVYKLVADSILRLNSSDMDIIQEVMNGTSIYSYKEANEFYSVLKDTLGFDGFVTYWTPADGSKKSEIVVAFDSNQFKLADNVAPTESNDIRYSVREDNEGNILSPGQQNYFKDSKAVDENGNLLAMYHGTENDTFDTFKANEFIKEANGTSKIVGYFSTNPEYSQAFGNITKYYLNVLNPLDFREFDGNGSLDSYIKWFEKKGIKNVKFDTAIEQEKLKGGKFVDENGKEYTSYYPHELIDYTYYWNGDGNLTEAIEAAGYDALLWLEGFEDEDLAYMPFNANAIKRADNLDPTNDERTQFSIRETDPNLVTDDRKEKIKTLKEDIALLKERANLDKQESKGQFWKPETLDAVAKYIIDETKTTVARKELREDLSALYNTIAYSVTQEEGAAPNSSEAYERIMNNCYKLASKIYEASPMKVKVDANVDPSAKQTIAKIKEQDAIQDLAVKIYNKYWSVKRLETVADKYQKKVDALEKEHKKNMTVMLKKQGLADEIFYKDIINKVKKQAAEEKAKYKEKNKQKAEAQKEANERRAEIEKITDQAKTLSKWLFQNSKNHPVPDPLKTPLIKMLAAIDPSSKQLLGLNNNSEKAFTPTKKDESMSLILGEVAEALKNINQEVSDSEKQDGNKESGLGFLDVPQYMIAKLDKIAKDMHRLEYKYDTLGKKILELMDLESLQELRNDISMIKTAISTVNYAISQGNKIRVNYVAQYIIQYLKDLGQAKRDSLGNLARPIDFLTLDNTTPYYFFKHLGKGGEIVFNILADGMDEMTDRVEKISDFTESLYTEEEQKKWRNNIREFELTQKLTETEKAEGKPNKVKVKLTDAQIMSLYCLAKRDINGEFQGLDHMLRDGIVIGQIDGKKKIGRQDTVTITQGQLDDIISIVEKDKRMKEVADGLVKFMSTTLSNWGNEVTWARWGIKQFVEDHYFPIAVNKETTKNENIDKSSSLFALLNQDFTKPLKKEVRNEIMVYDIFDVFTKHASDMARYSSLGLPILDTIKVWNYSEAEMKGDKAEEKKKRQEAEESGERYDRQRKVDSVKKSIAKAFGEKGGNRYISNLLKNLNGQADKGVYDNIGMGMMKRYKASKIAASTMTALVQPLSYLRAGYVMSPKYMLEALTKAPQTEKMFKNVPVAKWKRMSLGVDTNIGRGVDRIINHQNTFGDKIVDKSLWLAEKMDELTWGYIYNACEAEIKATRKDRKPGTKEFDQAVADRAREVIYSTQIFDSTLTRSSFMRDKGYHAQMLSAFMSEPTLSYNMLLDSVTQYFQDAKKNGSAHAFKNKGKVVVKAISVYTLSAVVESVIREAFTRLRDYQDDDEEFFEDFWKDVIDRLKDELNILNKLPYAKQLMDAIEAFGKAYQNNNKMDEAFIQDIGKSIKAIDKAMESQEISYNTVYTVLNALADVTGLPFGNALREVKMIWNNTIGRVTGKYIQK